MSLYLAQDADADALLDRDPFALLLGMMLDQQIPMEKAFFGPKLLAERMGVERLDPADIARHEPDTFAKIFAGPPAIHRFPGAMAARAQALATVVAERYDGDAAAIWTGVDDGNVVLDRLLALPGFGGEKAKIMLAILGKRIGVQPKGWEAAAAPFSDEVRRTVADADTPEHLLEVRAFKKLQKASKKSKADAPT
jgi:uncharacterized HhH-GPD family protein